MSKQVAKEPFYQYAEGVLSGKIIAGNYIRLAVERFYRDLDRKDFEFDYKEGMRIVKFAELCRHWKGPKKGTPIILDPHQHFYLIQKYGWRNKNTGLPRFRRSFKEIARKTGKTTEAAIESLFHMAKGLEESAQVWCGANKEADAILVVNDAGRIAQASPELRSSFTLQIHEPYVRRVIYKKRDAFMTFMTAQPQDGADVSMGIGDECHDWKDASTRNRIEAGMGNRIAPIFSAVTTAGFNKFSYCYSTLRSTATKVLEGSVEDDEHLIFIYEMDDSDNWEDEKMWIKSNPNILYLSDEQMRIQKHTQLPYLRDQLKKAQNEGGEIEVNFKTKNLNMWTDSFAVWIQDATWVKNAHGINPELLKDYDCYGGLYTSSSESLNAFILYFPDVKDKQVFMSWTWLPEKYVKSNSDQVDYQKWVDSGFVKETPGTDHDHIQIAQDIIEICSKYSVQAIGFEQMFAQYVAPELDREGYKVMQINQGFNNLGQQTALLKKLAGEGNIEHFKNPVLRWQIANVITHRNSKDGTEKPDRAASGSRIGVVSACLNAMVAKFELTKEVMTDFSFK